MRGKPRSSRDTNTPGSRRRIPDPLAPRFDAGRPCLNLLATLGRRGGEPIERVPTPKALAGWLVDAGLLDQAPAVNTRGFHQMRELRDAMYTVIDAARRGQRPARTAVARVNAAAALPTPQPQLAGTGRTATHRSGRPLWAALAVLARDAIDLVTGSHLARVRECADSECRMLFLDNSRGGRRRWCAMTRCGNRAKARAHAARTRRTQPSTRH